MKMRPGPPAQPRPLLEVMAVAWGENLKFDQDFIQAFGERNAVQTQFIPNSRLEVYRQLFHQHASEPDLLELDIVWPAILAADLIDLRPYLKESINVFPPQLLENYTVQGRLVALPLSVDIGVLYYRPQLLEKYGFTRPPDTWEELETMAKRIQAGERRAGNKDFWGYTWQGSISEGGTCNALEWQASSGAGNFIESSRVHVRDARFASMLTRVAGWIGTISPPAEYVYREDDSVNLWDAGQTAFMRNWASGYGHFAKQPGKDRLPFRIAPLPAGSGGHRGTLGGIGMGVSRYAADRDSALKALFELTSQRNDLARSNFSDGIPTHSTATGQQDIKSRSELQALAAELMKSAVSRPALFTGDKYESVSLAYATAVNSVLRRKATPEAAMADLEQKLTKLTGLPAQ
jgi:trehalose/maltose transport system substrate-binding protein